MKHFFAFGLCDSKKKIGHVREWISLSQSTTKRESEMMEKYFELARELKKLYVVNVLDIIDRSEIAEAKG